MALSEDVSHTNIDQPVALSSALEDTVAGPRLTSENTGHATVDGDRTTPADNNDPLAMILRDISPLVAPKDWQGGHIDIAGYRFPASTTLCLRWAIKNIRSHEYLAVFAEQLNSLIFNRQTESEDDAEVGVDLLRGQFLDGGSMTVDEFNQRFDKLILMQSAARARKSELEQGQAWLCMHWGDHILQQQPWLTAMSGKAQFWAGKVARNLDLESFRHAAHRQVLERLGAMPSNRFAPPNADPTALDVETIYHRRGTRGFDTSPLSLTDPRLVIRTRLATFIFKPSATTASLERDGQAVPQRSTYIASPRVHTVPNTPAAYSKPSPAVTTPISSSLRRCTRSMAAKLDSARVQAQKDTVPDPPAGYGKSVDGSTSPTPQSLGRRTRSTAAKLDSARVRAQNKTVPSAHASEADPVERSGEAEQGAQDNAVASDAEQEEGQGSGMPTPDTQSRRSHSSVQGSPVSISSEGIQDDRGASSDNMAASCTGRVSEDGNPEGPDTTMSEPDAESGTHSIRQTPISTPPALVQDDGNAAYGVPHSSNKRGRSEDAEVDTDSDVICIASTLKRHRPADSTETTDIAYSCGCVKVNSNVHKQMQKPSNEPLRPSSASRLARHVIAVFERHGKVCDPHLQCAARSIGLRSDQNTSELVRRLRTWLQAYDDDRLVQFARNSTTSRWLLRIPDYGQDAHAIGAYAYKHTAIRIKVTDERARSIANAIDPDIWSTWRDQGTVKLFIFTWWEKEDLLDIARGEFDMYRHHERNEADSEPRVWQRTMWHSLTQQAMRMDPEYFVLNVCLREDHNHRLISNPCCTKYIVASDKSEPRQLGLHPAPFTSARSASIIHGCLSLDDDTVNDCATLIPGTHIIFDEWVERLQVRGKQLPIDGVAEIDDAMWTKEDSKDFRTTQSGHARKAGLLQLSRPEIIHGTIGPARGKRRSMLPWLVGIRDDHQTLELPALGTWSDLSAAHNLLVPVKRATHEPAEIHDTVHYPFQAALPLEVDEPICKALVGKASWDSRAVVLQLQVLLGDDDVARRTMIEEIRRKIAEAWKAQWEIVKRMEEDAFEGSRSFSRSQRSLAGRPSQDVDDEAIDIASVVDYDLSSADQDAIPLPDEDESRDIGTSCDRGP